MLKFYHTCAQNSLHPHSAHSSSWGNYAVMLHSPPLFIALSLCIANYPKRTVSGTARYIIINNTMLIAHWNDAALQQSSSIIRHYNPNVKDFFFYTQQWISFNAHIHIDVCKNGCFFCIIRPAIIDTFCGNLYAFQHPKVGNTTFSFSVRVRKPQQENFSMPTNGLYRYENEN